MKVKFMVVLVIMVLAFSSNVNAYNKELAKAGDAKKVEGWHQSNKGADNPSCPSNAWNFEVASGRTLGTMGCSYFAASYMLVKMGEGDVNNGFTPVKFAKQMSDKGYFMGNNYADFERIENLYPNVTCKVCKGNCSGTTTEQQLAYIKGKFNEGYFIILCIQSDKTQGHYIFVDGFTEDGDMLVGDSAYQGIKWSETHGNFHGSVATISLFKHKNVKANECSSIYDNQKLDNPELSTKEKAIYDDLIHEWGLEGMPSTPNLIGEQDPIYFDDREGLSKEELNVVNEVKGNIENRHITIAKVINVLVSFIGIVLCAYSIALFVAGVFDISNAWLEFSLVERLTFGRCRVLHELDVRDLKTKKGDFTLKQLAFRCATIFVTGLIIISGVLQNTIGMILGLLIK